MTLMLFSLALLAVSLGYAVRSIFPPARPLPLAAPAPRCPNGCGPDDDRMVQLDDLTWLCVWCDATRPQFGGVNVPSLFPPSQRFDRLPDGHIQPVLPSRCPPAPPMPKARG